MKILKRLLPAQDVDALLGDIVEESHHRSRLWYWAQIVAVVIVGSFRDVRKHPVLAIRAIGIGVVALAALAALFYPASALSYVLRVLSDGGYYIGGYWLTVPHAVVLALPFVVNPIGFAMSGWLVARLHRRYGLAMVMPWALLVSTIPIWVAMQLTLYREAGTRLAPLPQLLVGFVVTILSLPGWTVLGGILGARATTRRA